MPHWPFICEMLGVVVVLQYLGIQDASCKRCPPSQAPGVWAGAINRILKEGIRVSIPQEKWERTQQILADLQVQVELCAELDHKQLERDRGFLVYITWMFTPMRLYLKGIQLTLDGWREGRSPSGWKLPLHAGVGDVLDDMKLHFGVNEPKVY